MNNNLDKFGEFIVTNLWDSALDRLNALLEGEINAPALQELQIALASLNEEQKAICNIRLD